MIAQKRLFNSPSYAAAFVIGGNANGLIDWKTKDGITLKNCKVTHSLRIFNSKIY